MYKASSVIRNEGKIAKEANKKREREKGSWATRKWCASFANCCCKAGHAIIWSGRGTARRNLNSKISKFSTVGHTVLSCLSRRVNALNAFIEAKIV